MISLVQKYMAQNLNIIITVRISNKTPPGYVSLKRQKY